MQQFVEMDCHVCEYQIMNKFGTTIRCNKPDREFCPTVSDDDPYF